MILSRNRLFALMFRIAASLIGIFGIVVMTIGGSPALMAVYYTMQTNVFTVLLFLVLAVRSAVQMAKEGKIGEVAGVNPVVHAGITFYIMITFVGYWALLSWQKFSMGNTGTIAVLTTIGNYVVHGVIPLMALADWILFVPHGKLRPNAALLWLIYPVLYAVFIFVRADLGAPLYGSTRYPYPFVDVDLLGGYVVLTVAALAAAFYGLGRLTVFADRKIAAALTKRHGTVGRKPIEPPTEEADKGE